MRIEIQLYTMFFQLGIYLMTIFGEYETSIFARGSDSITVALKNVRYVKCNYDIL